MSNGGCGGWTCERLPCSNLPGQTNDLETPQLLTASSSGLRTAIAAVEYSLPDHHFDQHDLAEALRHSSHPLPAFGCDLEPDDFAVGEPLYSPRGRESIEIGRASCRERV